MDFSFTKEEEMLRQTAREFAEREIPPYLEEMEETGKPPMKLIEKMAELGFTGILVPEEYGGTGLGHIARMIVLEEIGRISPALAFTLQIHHLGTSPITYYGTEEQKKRWLPDLAQGKKIAALAVTEPSGGSDVVGLKTVAEKKGENYVINGRKCFCTNSHIAGVYGILAKTGEKEFSVFIVERDNPGLILGREEDKFGLRGCNTGEVILENCEVPAENMIGKPGDGLRVALSCISNVGRPAIAAIALGIIARCLEEAVKFSKERTLYGQPISKLQAIQWLVTDIYMQYEIGRLTTYYAAWLRDKGVRCDAENCLNKFQTTVGAVEAAHKLMQIQGGYGILRDYVAQRLLRDAEVLIPSAGTLEIQRLIMARAAYKKFE